MLMNWNPSEKGDKKCGWKIFEEIIIEIFEIVGKHTCRDSRCKLKSQSDFITTISLEWLKVTRPRTWSVGKNMDQMEFLDSWWNAKWYGPFGKQYGSVLED